MNRKKPKFKLEFLTCPQYTQFFSNNFLKLHGMPVRRNKHIRNEQKKQWERIIDKWNALGNPGPILTAEEIRRLLQ